MNKDELIQMHAFLLQVKQVLEDKIEKKREDFSSYAALDVAPYHIFKSKKIQKLAVFELCKGLSCFFD